MVRPRWVPAIPLGIASSIVAGAAALAFVSCSTPSHPPAEGDVYRDAATYVSWDARVVDATLDDELEGCAARFRGRLVE